MTEHEPNSKTRLADFNAAIKEIETARAEIYRASVAAPDADKLCPDFMAERLSEPVRFLEYPITVSGITVTPTPVLKPGWPSTPRGSFVAVRPCDEEYGKQTFLGVLLGDMATGASARFHPETGILEVGLSFHNPAI